MGQQRELFDKQPPPWVLDDQAEQCVAVVAFADVPFGPYDYEVPDALRGQLQAGHRVQVPLGRGNRLRVGYCTAVENRPRGPRVLKPLGSVVDAEVLLSPAMLHLTRWMADYYVCPWGQVLDAVVPAGVREQAGTREHTFLRVAPEIATDWTELALPAKQAEALRVLALAPCGLTPSELAEAAGCTAAPIQALRRKRLVCEEVRRVPQITLPTRVRETAECWILNDDQRQALAAILDPLREPRHETIVIHGVTGSGKTEVYMQAIAEAVSYGRQAIVLVPEISLTPQTRRRFESRFDRVAVLHSHMTASERHGHWRRIAASDVDVVIGARSAVFAPTPHLGLIVIDEEHDSSFKQDTAPRYHAREVAAQRAIAQRIPLVLGSATPSLESWHAARQGRYRLVDMPQRVSSLPLPDVATIDLRTRTGSRRDRGAISQPLYQAVREALRDGGQIILLLNRRGHSPTIQCPGCGHVVKCPHCDIALTHHRVGGKALCHYCDFETGSPTCCPACGADDIRFGGLGTQKLELEVQARFPGIACLRMDSDSMAKPGSHERALERFRSGEVKILLGTQMIAKGLDFPNVTLVGVINADTSLHFPDFRAAERTFQLVTQVAGRTGRGTQGGRVLVQTFSPEHPAIVAAQRHDYESFAREELPIRQQFGYPPTMAMVRVVVRGPIQAAVESFAQGVAGELRDAAAARSITLRLLGPVAAPLPKLRGHYRFHLLLYCADQFGLREVVRLATERLKPPPDVIWIVDVDPLDML